MTRAGQMYLWVVVCCGVAAVAHAVRTLWVSPVDLQWFILAGLTLLSGSFTVRIPGVPARLSVSETFVFAAVLLYGPAAATVIVVLDSLVISLWLRGQSRRGARVLFNMAAPAVAISLAGELFFLLADVPPLSQRKQEILTLVLPLFALAVCYFLLNSFFIAAAVAFQRHAHMFAVWRENFLWISLNYFSGASVAALLLPFLQSRESPFLQVIGVFLPLLLISYLTFKTALGRVEDANLHLAELNKLYLSTIETLAMAIDAKDQITHGHIRRVQLYAVKLAKTMGVNDPRQIQAIEAAALLHDMGKLAVPEYILNKPGPLTTAEFERMKLHASVGADILSAIDFPYPVVPIVRHHHENWNGSGYPSGLAGAEIPIGARILSVVDCFDALTSDRPYRPRLSDKEALRILYERRGNMYDPLVVDAFVRLYPDLVTDTQAPPEAVALAKITTPASDQGERSPAPPDTPLEKIAETQSETLGLLQLSQELATLNSSSQMAETILRRIRHLVPASLAAAFFVDEARQDLYVACVVGENEGLVAGLRIGLGSRLTGWVAANQRCIRNSDAVLDLGGAARSATPRLRSCMAIPVVSQGNCVAVVTLYSAYANAFSEEQERVVGTIVSHSAPALAAALRPSDGAAPKELARSSESRTDTLLYVRLESGADPTKHQERLAESIKQVIMRELSSEDTVLQPSAAELLVVIRGMTPATANATGTRIREKVALQIERMLGLNSRSVYIAPLLTTPAELEEETIVRLVRVRYAPDIEDDGKGRNDRVH